jgi:hypothetical protein
LAENNVLEQPILDVAGPVGLKMLEHSYWAKRAAAGRGREMTVASALIVGLIILVVASVVIIDELRKSTQSVCTAISIASGEICHEMRELRCALPHTEPELRQIIRLIENGERCTELVEIRSVLDNILTELQEIRSPSEPDNYDLMAENRQRYANASK